MDKKIHTYGKKLWPKRLLEMPQPPSLLWIRGNIPPEDYHYLCVVGSRKFSQYGKEAVEKIISGLRGYSFVIVSGLALGIDSIAHKAALDAGLKTIAIVGSGLEDSFIYPQTNLRLAKEIINSGGTLISEEESNFKPAPYSFPKRNRIMVGFSHSILVVEAAQKSGTLITSRLATEYNRDVLTIPGSIFSSQSEGPHMLIKLGATPITSSEDILEHFGLLETPKNLELFLDENENLIYQKLATPLTRSELYNQISLSVAKINEIITMLEIRECIIEIDGKICQK